MRLFVGLELPEALREPLVALCGGVSGVRWVPPLNLHLTLRFIGEASRDVAEEVDHALAGIRMTPFELALAGAGLFTRSGRTTALWAGVARSERLERLQAKVETALQRAGLAAERKRFQPHVTLARADGVPEPVLARWVQQHNLLRTEPVTLTHFTLFSSLLGKDDPVYTAEVDYAFG